MNGPSSLRNYRSIQRAGTDVNPLGTPYENNVPIWILRDPKQPLSQIWASLKDYSYAFGGL